MVLEVEMSRYLKMLRDTLKTEELEYLKGNPHQDKADRDRCIADLVENLENDSSPVELDIICVSDAESKSLSR